MRAAVRTKYGLPGDLSVKDIPMPVPKEGELLIKAHATTVNRSDCHELSGRPIIMRLLTGLARPRASIIGTDFAGEIVAAGPGAQLFKAGDRVMGFSGGLSCGSHAQYFLLPESKAAKIMTAMPAGLSYRDAAACLEGAVYAAAQVSPLKPGPGQNAMVYGATGAIGISYIQFLRHYGVSVTAVCRSEQSDLARSLGAVRVIDYTKEDFTKDSERYDYVFDAVGKSSFFKCRKLLKEKGGYTSSGGPINFFLVIAAPLMGGRKVFFSFAARIAENLQFIKGLIEKGEFRAVIDRAYPLDRIAEAYLYVATGQKIGNVVISMWD